MLFLGSLAEFVLACTRLPHKGLWVLVVLEEVEIIRRTAVWHTKLVVSCLWRSGHDADRTSKLVRRNHVCVCGCCFAAQSSVDSLCFWLGVRNEMKRETTSTYWYSPVDARREVLATPPRIWAVHENS